LTIATLAALNSLEVIRNKALRLITGAVKWTLLALMQVLTVNSPVKTEKEKMIIILHEKFNCLPHNNYWSQYRCPRNLKTQNVFMQKVTPLEQSYTLQITPEKLLLFALSATSERL
jgi:hypothetical protein